MTKLPDVDPGETGEWLESVDAVVENSGKGRADYLLTQVVDHARALGVDLPDLITTDYVNTIATEEDPLECSRYG